LVERSFISPASSAGLRNTGWVASLDEPRSFYEIRARLPAVTPRALALALRDQDAGLVRREVLPTRPPSTVYRATPRAPAVLAAPSR
jgi:DNA-binding HxlR family transcriptional regulator